jgi:hypothetical protein
MCRTKEKPCRPFVARPLGTVPTATGESPQSSTIEQVCCPNAYTRSCQHRNRARIHLTSEQTSQNGTSHNVQYQVDACGRRQQMTVDAQPPPCQGTPGFVANYCYIMLQYAASLLVGGQEQKPRHRHAPTEFLYLHGDCQRKPTARLRI